MTIHAEHKNEVSALVKEILGDQYTHLHVSGVTIEEDLQTNTSVITCSVTEQSTGERYAITGRGTGIIDAFFHAMVDRFAEDYPSLRTIRFYSFTVQAQLETAKTASRTDSEGEVTLLIANSEDKIFSFSHASRSIVGSGIIATLLGLEYFINSERAFVTIYHALKDARARNRPDLVQRYTGIMATLVQNTSYSDVISRIRQELG